MLRKNNILFFVCYTANELECPSAEWTKNNGFCYQHFPTLTTWPVADNACQSLNAHLVSIHSQEEQNLVTGKFQKYFLIYILKAQ